MRSLAKRKTGHKVSPSAKKFVGSPENKKANECKICCEFCSQTLDSESEKNLHILQHFAQEFCASCDKSLIRIGDALYVLHSTSTCIKTIKQENNVDYEINNDTDIFCEVGINTLMDENKDEIEDKSNLIKICSLNDEQNESSFDFSLGAEHCRSGSDDESPEYPSETLTNKVGHGPSHKRGNSGKQVTSDSKKYDCDICGESFTIKWNIRRHMKGHAASKKSKFKYKLTRKHLRRHPQKQEQSPREKFNPDSESFACDHCGSVFKTKFRIKRHVLTHFTGSKSEKDKIAHEIKKENDREKSKEDRHCKYDGCDYVGKRFALLSHVNKIHLHIRFTCEVCGKDSSSKKNLKRHELQHDPNREQKNVTTNCKICDASLADKSELNQHMKTVHGGGSGSKRYICGFCGKGISGSTQLREHEATHTGEKLYTCSYPGCGKQFRQRSAEAEHQRVHTGEKRFKCDQEGCNQVFGYAHHVKRHKTNVHKIWKETHKCQVCSDSFPTNATLNKHMKNKHNVEIMPFNR